MSDDFTYGPFTIRIQEHPSVKRTEACVFFTDDLDNPLHNYYYMWRSLTDDHNDIPREEIVVERTKVRIRLSMLAILSGDFAEKEHSHYIT